MTAASTATGGCLNSSKIFDLEILQNNTNATRQQELMSNNCQGSRRLESSMKSIRSLDASGTTSAGTDTGPCMKKSVSFSNFISLKRVPSLLDLISNEDTHHNKAATFWFGRDDVSKFAIAELSRRSALGITSTSALILSVPATVDRLLVPDDDDVDNDHDNDNDNDRAENSTSVADYDASVCCSLCCWTFFRNNN